MTEASKATTTAGRELVITRVIDAPRELVFKARTEPQHVARWFGPPGTTVPFCTMDARPRGALRFCYRLPAGDLHWMEGAYRDVVEPERIAFTDESGNLLGRPGFPLVALLTVAFADYSGGTRLTLRHAGVDQRELSGWPASLDRFARYVGVPDGNG
jgi:uncharacterized protein YndB with AHSA1/START domain